MKLRRLIILGAACVGVAVFAWTFYLILSSPYMVEQPHVRAFQAPMPLPPEGTVAVDASPLVPAEGFPPDTAESRSRGGVYYQYYCLFCHGANGDGRGPVAESYLPPPPDLRTPKVQSLSDADLLRAMLLGPGHEPVLAYTVRPAHRGYLVLYVRTFRQPTLPVGETPASK